MIKKQNLKKPAFGTKKERIILWSVILTLIIIQALSAWYISELWKYNSDTSSQSLYLHISKSEEKRYKYPVIDIAEDKVYIPEARIYLPLNDTTRNLRYEYINNKDYKSLNLSVSSAVGTQNGVDDPTCDKVVMVSPSKESLEYPYVDGGEIKPTVDGLRYVSVHNKETCGTYFGDVQQGLVEAVKLITQY